MYRGCEKDDLLRVHPVRVVLIVGVIAAIAATYLPWVWVGGIGGLKGWNLGIWAEGTRGSPSSGCRMDMAAAGSAYSPASRALRASGRRCGSAVNRAATIVRWPSAM